MQRVKPLSYIESTVSSGPGSILTAASAGNGSVAKWKQITTEDLIDPSGALSVATLVSTYNDLVWGMRQSGMVVSAPRIWFGATGVDGILMYVNGLARPLYRPPQLLPYRSFSITDILTDLNAALGTTNAQFHYDGSTVSLMIKEGTSIQFAEPYTSLFGSAKRMLNRIFAREDMGSIIGVSQNGKKFISGNTLAGPVSGAYPAPAPASGLQILNVSGTSFDLQWTASPTPGAVHYVWIQASGVSRSFYTGTNTTKTLGTADGLAVGVSYTVSIVASSPYEISTVGNPTGSVVMATAIPAPNLSNAGTTTTSVSVAWTPTTLYQIRLRLINPADGIVLFQTTVAGSLGTYTFSALDPATAFSVSASYTADGSIFGPPDTLSISTATLTVPAISLSTGIDVIPTAILSSAPNTIYVDTTVSNFTSSFDYQDRLILEVQKYDSVGMTWWPYTETLYAAANVDYDSMENTWSFPAIEAAVARLWGFDPKIQIRTRAKYIYHLNGNVYESAWSSYTSGLITYTPQTTLVVGPNTTSDTLDITWDWPWLNMLNDSSYIMNLSISPGTETASVPAELPGGGGNSHPFTGLTTGIPYTVSGLLTYNGSIIQDLTITQELFPPPLTRFGVFTPTDYSEWGNFSRGIGGGGLPLFVGFRVPPGSAWVNYKFRYIDFPLLSYPPASIYNALYNVYSLNGSEQLKVQVYSDSTRTTLLHESGAQTITKNSNIQAYTFDMNTDITLAANMCIIFIITNGGEISFSLATLPGSFPLVGIYGDPTNGQAVTDDGGKGPECDFYI